jgi:hypothetical protein
MLMADLANWIDAAGIADGDALAGPVFTAMAGAVAVSRAVSDKRLSDELLAAARQSIKERLGLNDTPLLSGATR